MAVRVLATTAACGDCRPFASAVRSLCAEGTAGAFAAVKHELLPIGVANRSIADADQKCESPYVQSLT